MESMGSLIVGRVNASQVMFLRLKGFDNVLTVLDPRYYPLLVTAVHVAFFVFLIAQIVLSRFSSRKETKYRKASGTSLGVLHSAAKWICVALFLFCGMLMLELMWETWSASAGVQLPIYRTLSYTCQSLAWLIISIALHREEVQDRSVHSNLIRTWWLASLLLSILAIGTAVITKISFLSAGIIFVPFISSLFLVIFGFMGYIYGPQDEESDIKRRLLSDSFSDETEIQSPIESGFSRAGVLSVLTFSWLNPLLSAGNQRPLVIHDVPLLDPIDDADSNYEAFQACWERLILESPPGASPSIEWTLWKTFWKPFMGSLLMAFVWSCVMFFGPILQNLLIAFMEEENRVFTTGVTLVLVLFSGKFVEALSSHQLAFRSRKLGLRMWSAVGCAVYNKSLRLSIKARQVRSVGEVTNLLSTDVQRLLELTYYVQQGLALPLQVLIAVLILFQVVGVAMVAGLTALVIVLFSNLIVVRKMRKYRSQQVVAKDKRIQATTECLGNMKVIKLQAWDEMFKARIQRLRESERSWVQRFMYAGAITIFILWSGPLVVSAVTFLTMILLGNTLTTARVFTALTTFRIIQEPIKLIPDIFSYVIQATVSLERIRSFLREDEIDEDSVERIAEEDSSYAVEIEGASFTWDKVQATSAIKDLTLKIQKGACVAICGGVGSGKSSLLYCIMGELPKLSGMAKLSGRIAYVAQSAWIQNNSIQENILFGLEMNLKRYHEAVRVTGLQTDLAQFPEGDQTEIGERGTNLSGGQKQRIQLARAVYQDADIYLLDDPFSAVDAHTGTYLFEQCVKGVLKDKTVILVTHQVEFLPSTDLIIVMRAPGEIVQIGTYNELVEEGKDFGSFVDALNASLESVTQATHKKLEEDEDSSQTIINGGLTESLSRKLSRQMSRTGSLSSTGSRRGSEIADDRASTKVKLIQEELRETGRVDGKVVWTYLTKFHGGVVCFIIIFPMLTTVLGQVSSDAWLAWGTSNGQITSIRFIEIYILLIVGCSISVFLRSTLVAFTGVATAQAFFKDMLNSIMRAPMSFLDSTPLGRILSRSTTDQNALDLDLPLAVSSTVSNGMSAIVSILITIFVTKEIVVIVTPLAWMYVRLQIYYITSARELSRLTSLTEAPVFLHLSESIAGATTIRAFQEKRRFTNTNAKLFEFYQRAYFHNLTATEWLGLRLDSLGATVLSASALLLITLPENTISPGSAGMSLSYSLFLSSVLMRLVNSASTVENKMVSVERVSQYSNIPSEAPVLIPDRRPPSDWPNAGRIELQKLKIRYRVGAPLVLKGISCVIHQREKVGVVGRTGSGKSTLIQAIFRLIEPSGGRILIDGLDITTIGLNDLRSRLGVIPQDPTLFEGTVRSNVDPFNLYSDEQVWEALEKCQLGQILRDKPQRLDAPVSEQGENWSVGERQLLCLGRVLLKRARILVLDEATASVDITTDAVIQHTIKQHFADCTVISVAHRIPTVIDSDRVLVLDAGYLIENNSPEVLLSNDNSVFSKLVQEYTQRSGSDSNLHQS